MAQSPKEAKFKFGNESFPILFEDGLVRVYKNPVNEIFVEDIHSGAEIRVRSQLQGLVFTTGDRVEPTRVANGIGWLVSPRRT